MSGIEDAEQHDYKPHMTTNVLDQSKQNTRIAVAMSGGVDSSVTASILTAEGYDVVGLTMQLYDHGSETAQSKTCCAGQDIYDARRVADKIGIPHYVLDYEKRFEESVIKPFAQSYLKGETPIPCILCNQTVKFHDLIGAAKGIGAAALATGHYIRRVQEDSKVSLCRARDRDKDQSYFLFATTREQLEFLRFPLGDLTKSDTRDLAKSYELNVAAKPESQDICFVPTGRYTNIVGKYSNEANTKGHFIHMDGRDLGVHEGIEHYTVGQRRGLRLGGEAEPLYVVAVNDKDNFVLVGPKSALSKAHIITRDVNWLGRDTFIPDSGLHIEARVRNTHEPVPAYLRPHKNPGQAVVEFEHPLFGVSPGQACVFYQGDYVLGGGWIMRDEASPFVPHNKRLESTVVAK